MHWLNLALACAGLALAGLLLSGCGSSGERPTTSSTVAQPVSPTRLVVKDLKRGTGAALPPISHKPRVTMTLLYTATVYKTGKLFEKRQNIRHPAKIEYGPGLSQGWEDGLAGMRVGGRRRLVVPASEMVEGPASVYVVKLLGFKKNGTKIYARALRRGLMMSKAEIAKLPPLAIPRQSGPPPRHLKVIDLRKGTGAVLKKWDGVYVRYFEASYSDLQKKGLSGRYGPQTFGLDNTVRGWTVGLPGMRVGGRRELVLPPKLAYPRWKPSWGYAPYVRVYVIDLIGAKPPVDPYSEAAALRRKSQKG